MFQTIQKNFLFIWILLLLAIAIILTLTFSGCSSKLANSPATSNLAKETDVHVQTGCTDSDSGKNLQVKGVVAVGNVSYADKCVAPFLIEYYCENGQIASQNFRCEKGCDKGICL